MSGSKHYQRLIRLGGKDPNFHSLGDQPATGTLLAPNGFPNYYLRSYYDKYLAEARRASMPAAAMAEQQRKITTHLHKMTHKRSKLLNAVQKSSAAEFKARIMNRHRYTQKRKQNRAVNAYARRQFLTLRNPKISHRRIAKWAHKKQRPAPFGDEL